MELFYHASRDIELPRSSRRSRFQPGARACEACGAELAGAEQSEAGTYGLTFCADCHARLDRSAIQIHFCDSCSVSIPLYAVEGGSALVGDGRILCLACRGGGSRDVRMRRLLLVAVAALALGLSLGWLLL